MHAASVGESLSLLPLIAAIGERWPNLVPLVTTGTPTSAALMAQRLPPSAIHQYMPVDVPAAVERFLLHWQPNLALWIESELWPNALLRLRLRNIPAVLVNARMSDRSFRRWQRLTPVAAAILRTFRAVLAQSEDEATRYRALGARGVSVAGNLKAAAPPLPDDAAARSQLQAEFGSRPRWLAASTHEGEEAMAARVHRALAGSVPDLLTVVVPRHPARGPTIAAQLAAAGLTVALRSRGDGVTPRTSVYVADTLGELGTFYRLSPVVFLGGSLVPHGGHNPLEPARVGAAIVVGPHVHNFRELVDQLVAAGGLVPVATEDGLTKAVSELLREPGQARRLGANALGYAEAQAAVLPQVVAALAPWLAPL